MLFLLICSFVITRVFRLIIRLDYCKSRALHHTFESKLLHFWNYRDLVLHLFVPFVGNPFRNCDRCQSSRFCADNSARDLEISRIFQNVLWNLSCLAWTSISSDKNNLKCKRFACKIKYKIYLHIHKKIFKLNMFLSQSCERSRSWPVLRQY